MTTIRMTPGVGAQVSKAVSDIRKSALDAALSENETRINSVGMNAKFCSEVSDAAKQTANAQAEAMRCEANSELASAITSGIINGSFNIMQTKEAFKVSTYEEQLDKITKFNVAVNPNGREIKPEIQAANPDLAENSLVKSILDQDKNAFKNASFTQVDKAAENACLRGDKAKILENTKKIREDLRSQLKEAQDAQTQYMNMANQWSSIAVSATKYAGKASEADAQTRQGIWEANKLMSQNNQQNTNNIAETASKGFDAELQAIETARRLDEAAFAANGYARG